MKASFVRKLLGFFGWKSQYIQPADKKCVIISAPHTSNMDFVIGWLYFQALDVPAKFLIKKELFFWPLGPVLKAMGALPVDRSKAAVLTDQLIGEFKKRDEFYLLVTPEGSRSKRPVWKRGFYFIAQKAGVPIYLGKLDYGKKLMITGKRFVPTGDVKADMREIKRDYIGITAKHPENFSIGDAADEK